MTVSMNVVGQQMVKEDRQTVKNTSLDGSKAVPNAVEKTVYTPPDGEKLKAQIEQLQEFSNILGRKVEFNVNKDLKRVIIKVIDPSTDKVIKEIPSVDMQRMLKNIQDAIGVIVDEKR